MRLKREDLVKMLKHPVKTEDKFAADLIKDQRFNGQLPIVQRLKEQRKRLAPTGSLVCLFVSLRHLYRGTDL